MALTPIIMDRPGTTPRGHSILGIFIILFTWAVYITDLIISSLAGQGIEPFHNSTGAISFKYDLDVTPIPIIFAIVWPTIYAWQALWLLYALLTLCRRMRNTGSYLYVYPPLIPKSTYIFFILNNIATTAWLFLWDREMILYAIIPLVLSAFTLYLSLGFTAAQTYKHGKEFIENGQGYELCIVRTLCHNGLAFYAEWVSIATLLNVGAALAYRADLDQALSCTIVLLILAVEVVLWFVIDLFIWDRYTRYIFTPYVVLILALVGVVLKKFEPTEANTLIALVLLATVSLMFLAKLVAACWRGRNRPLYGPSEYLEPLVVRYGTFIK